MFSIKKLACQGMINGFCTDTLIKKLACQGMIKGTLIKSLAEKIKCRTKAFKLSMKPWVKFQKIRKFLS